MAGTGLAADPHRSDRLGPVPSVGRLAGRVKAGDLAGRLYGVALVRHGPTWDHGRTETRTPPQSGPSILPVNRPYRRRPISPIEIPPRIPGRKGCVTLTAVLVFDPLPWDRSHARDAKHGTAHTVRTVVTRAATNGIAMAANRRRGVTCPTRSNSR